MKMFANLLTFGADDPRTRTRRGWASFAAFGMALLLGAGAPLFAIVAVALLFAAGLWQRNRTLRVGMKPTLASAMAVFAFAVLSGGPRVQAQTPANIYGVGLSANPGQSPSVSGTALWAHSLNGSGTYVGTIVDFLPETIKPIVVSTNAGAFVAQKVATVAGHDIFATGSTGIAIAGAHTGWNYTGGGAIFFKLPQPNWFLSANVRFSKSTVSGGNDFQIIPGVQLNWGK